MRSVLAAMLLLVNVLTIFAVPPDLRDQVSLNGTWSQGGQVPNRLGFNLGQTAKYTYERSVAVPASWAGKIIKLCFRAVNYSCDIYVNGTKVSSFGIGWVPFDVDITPHVQAGASFTLRVVVGSAYVNGQAQYGVGQDWWARGDVSGIIDDVWLRGFGTVCINDAFIKTSYQNKTITVDYTVKNYGTQSRTVTIKGDVSPSTSGTVVKTLTSNPVTLAAGQEKVVTVSASWTDPQLWWPDQPNLYHIASQVLEGTTVVDRETRRFGFREMWISGIHFILNGIRSNQRGDNTYVEDNLTTVARVESQVARWKQLNMNIFRWHAAPVPEYMMDVCDEKGFMVVNESPLYGTNGLNRPGGSVWIDHCHEQFTYWIKGSRNHPSVVRWSVSNEALSLLSAQDHHDLGVWVKQNLDPTRANFCEERESWAPFNMDVECEHYPEGYEGTPSGSIYSWGSYIKSKPKACGEYITDYGSNGAVNQWWQGTWSRGMRYTNWADLRPFTCDWAWSGSSSKIDNLANSFNPVALFDKAYDDLGLGPVKDGAYPSIAAGSTANRTLILYNDEYRGDIVTAKVEIKSGSTVHAMGIKTYRLTLGEHMDIPCSFQVPYVGGSTMDMVLSTSKGGTQKFSEAKRFNVTGASSGSSSNAVTLGGTGIDPDKPFIQISPTSISVSGETGSNAADKVVTVGNAAGGTLATVNARVSYGPGASGWINPVVGGQGNSQQITLRFINSSVSGGTFTANLIVSASGAGPDSVVCPITLTQVGPDHTPPRVERVSGTRDKVVVVFNEPVDGAGANLPANYSLSGGATVSGAELSSTERIVTLTVSPLTVGASYTLTINNIRDKASTPNAIEPNTKATFVVSAAITKIRFYPRAGQAARMVNGYFEGTPGTVTDLNYLTLYKITTAPADNQWTEVTTIENADYAYKVLRFVSQGFGNVAEVEFYCGDVKLTGTPFGTDGTHGNSGNDYRKVFDGDINTYFDCNVANAEAGIILNQVATKKSSRPGEPQQAFSLRIDNFTMRVPISKITAGQITVAIYNLRGGLIRSVRLSEAALDGGTDVLQFGSLPRGQYIVQVKNGSIETARSFGMAR